MRVYGVLLFLVWSLYSFAADTKTGSPLKLHVSDDPIKPTLICRDAVTDVLAIIKTKREDVSLHQKTLQESIESALTHLEPDEKAELEKVTLYKPLLERDQMYKIIADDFRARGRLKKAKNILSDLTSFQVEDEETQRKITRSIFDRMNKAFEAQNFTEAARDAKMDPRSYADFINFWKPKLKNEPDEVQAAILLLLHDPEKMAPYIKKHVPSGLQTATRPIRATAKWSGKHPVVATLLALSIVGATNFSNILQSVESQAYPVSQIRNQIDSLQTGEEKHVAITKYLEQRHSMSDRELISLTKSFPKKGYIEYSVLDPSRSVPGYVNAYRQVTIPLDAYYSIKALDKVSKVETGAELVSLTDTLKAQVTDSDYDSWENKQLVVNEINKLTYKALKQK
jgi:hypothetical protein